jgi:hypothetical protein
MLRKPTMKLEYTSILSQDELDRITAKAMKNEAEACWEISRLYQAGYFAPCAMHDAYDWIEKAADAGNVEAMTTIGFRYAQGDLQSTKVAKGIQLLEKAAKLGDVNAMTELGRWYDERHFWDDTFPAKAIYWSVEAANHGSLPSMQQLSEMYAEGRHIKKNTEKSRSWRRKMQKQDSYYTALSKAQKIPQNIC